MALTFNIYTSNQPDGVYTRIASGLTTTTYNINATNSIEPEIKYVRMSASNEAGEGFLSKPTKLIYIGLVKKPEVLKYFKGGFLLNYEGAGYATSTELQKSADGNIWTQVAATTSSLQTSAMVEGLTMPTSFRSIGNAENSYRESVYLSNITPQTVNLAFTHNKIFQSLNGKTWSELSTTEFPPFVIPTLFYCGGKGFIAQAIYPSGWTKISQDNGVTWSNCPTLPDLTIINSVAIGNGICLAVAGTGVFKSLDNGATWVKVSSQWFNTIEYLGNGWFIAGRSGENTPLMQSNDGGATWSYPVPFLGTWSSFLAIGNDVVLGGQTDGGIWRSTVGGFYSWQQTNVTTGRCSNMVYLGNNTVLARVALDGRTIIKRSVNAGLIWSDVAVFEGVLSSNSYDGSSQFVYAGGGTVILARKTDSLVLEIYYSTNSGSSWQLSFSYNSYGVAIA